MPADKLSYAPPPRGGRPTVSVLVPIYNAQRYLRRCLDSLTSQAYGDFEAILVDDGSTDGSREIMASYAHDDERIGIIDKPNSGYGASMNAALDVARGSYLAILESDDFFEPDALGVLYAAATRYDADVAKGDFWLYWEEGGKRRVPMGMVAPGTAGRPLCPRDDLPDLFLRKPSIWSALYRRAFLEAAGIRFLETPGASYQDASFNFKVLAMAERVVLVDRPVLSYRQDNEASSVNAADKAFCVCDEYAEMRDYLDRHHEIRDGLLPLLVRMKLDSYAWNYDRLAPSLREAFLSRARAELARDQQDGLVDDALYDPVRRAALAALIDRPDRFARFRREERAPAGSALGRLAHYLRLGGVRLVADIIRDKVRGR